MRTFITILRILYIVIKFIVGQIVYGISGIVVWFKINNSRTDGAWLRTLSMVFIGFIGLVFLKDLVTKPELSDGLAGHMNYDLSDIGYDSILVETEFAADETKDSNREPVAVELTGNRAISKETGLKINDAEKYPYGNNSEIQNYITRFQNTAIAEMDKFGIPASITLAQGIKESEYGKSELSRKSNNHFGIKCMSKKCKRGHCTNKEDDFHKDYFVNYNNAWESYRAHSNFLTGDRYRTLRKHGKDYKKWAWGLQNRGYATDPHYAESIILIIEKYQLYRFDDL